MTFIKKYCLQYLETSVWKLKFAPDWDSAANELNKAAVAFRVGQSPAQAKDAHLRAAEAYANNGNLYHAGKQLDQVTCDPSELVMTDVCRP